MSRLIDADALIPDRDYYEGGGYDAVSCEQIDKAPSVDVIPNKEGYEMYNKGYMSGYERGKEERPQGEWVVGEYMDCHSDILPKYTCPFCGEVVYRKYDFCHCGADMRGGRE